MISRALLGVLAVVAAACAPEPVDPPEPTYSEHLSPSELETARRGFEVFSRVCQPLMGSYGADIVEIEVSEGFSREMEHKFDPDYGFRPFGCVDYRCESFGWDRQLYIRVVISGETEIIPARYRAQRQHLHFRLGGPANPGITTTKRPELCGFSLGDGDEIVGRVVWWAHTEAR